METVSSDDAGVVDIQATSVARLIFALLRERFSGQLKLQQGPPTGGPRSIWFQGGMPIFTDWTSPEDCLGQVLVDMGELTPTDRDRAVLAREATPGSQERFGHFLIRRRMITTAQLRKGLRVQCARKLVHCFALRSGQVELQSGESSVVDQHTLGAQVNPLELIFAGVQTHYDLARVASELGHRYIAPLRLRSSLGRYRDHFHFSAEDNKIADAFADPATITEVAARTNQRHLRVAQVAYTLWACQMLRPVEATTREITKSSPVLPPELGQTGRIGVDVRQPEHIAAFTSQLERFEAAIQSGAHAFALLGVPLNAERSQIRAAWQALSRRFHPDALSFRELGHLRQRSAAVFASLNEAHQILGDPRQRTALLALLQRDDDDTPPSASPRQPTPQETLEIEALSDKAEQLLRAGNFASALEHYQQAQALQPDNPDLKSAIAWCVYQSSSDKHSMRMATEQALLGVLAHQPRTARTHYFLGLLRLHAGEDESALTAFTAALAIDPEMLDAQRQVHAIKLRRSAPTAP